MLAFLPPDHLFPQVGPQIAEGRVRAPVPEVRGPATQHPVEMDEQDAERQVRVLPAPRLDLGLNGGQRLLGRVDVDVVLAGAPLTVTLDAPAEKSRPSSMWVTRVFSGDRRRPITAR